MSNKLSKKKKYMILESFTYRGSDGRLPLAKRVIIGPGEQLPKLDSNELERLLHEGRIAEVDLYGEAIPNKRLESMNAEKIDKMFSGKAEVAIIRIVEATNFDKDTLCRVLVFCEQNKLNTACKAVEVRLDS